MCQDEVESGRINKLKHYWCENGIRSSVPCNHIRACRYAYRAVEPLTGDGYYFVVPYCNTLCISIFSQQLSEQYSKDIILLCCDGAAWLESVGLVLPENIVLFHYVMSISLDASRETFCCFVVIIALTLLCAAVRSKLDLSKPAGVTVAILVARRYRFCRNSLQCRHN